MKKIVLAGAAGVILGASVVAFGQQPAATPEQPSAPGGIAWEYKVVRASGPSLTEGKYISKQEEVLNKEGRDGWKLSLHTQVGSDAGWFYFERPK